MRLLSFRNRVKAGMNGPKNKEGYVVPQAEVRTVNTLNNA
ncbi:MAG: hypothetical protein ACI9DJ_002397 [Algoriphagus sp.]|jgi:hypothetical protein